MSHVILQQTKVTVTTDLATAQRNQTLTTTIMSKPLKEKMRL